MKSSSFFIRKRGEQILGLYFQSLQKHKNNLFFVVFFFAFETAFADNYSRAVISHLTTARQISVYLAAEPVCRTAEVLGSILLDMLFL